MEKYVTLEESKVNYKKSIGFLFNGKGATNTAIVYTCPCGVVHEYSLWNFPKNDTLSNCGNPDHWVVKYENGAEPE
jgi:hypothetical protein